ncbi:MAG: hypothetical protein HUU55_01085 [Myxococcales bacterium]|nr:hypothetical protein [Myxococcales bacterium]
MTSLRYYDRQDSEEARPPTRTTPDLTLLRGLRLIDSRAFDNWVWATEDEALATICGVRSGSVPHVPETILLPHRMEPVLDTLRTEIRRARSNEPYLDALRYAISLGATNPAELRKALVIAEIRGRARVSAVDDLVCSPKARTRRVDIPLIESLCSRIQPGKGVRKVLRNLLSRPARIRAGLNLRQTMVPLLSAELLTRIRDARRQTGDVTERVREWLDREGRSLRNSVLALIAAAAKAGSNWPEPLAQLGQFVGADEHTDGILATAVVLRAYVEAVKGPQYEAQVTPMNGNVVTADPNKKLVLMWCGPTAVFSVVTTAPNEWKMVSTKHPASPPELVVQPIAVQETLVRDIVRTETTIFRHLERQNEDAVTPLRNTPVLVGQQDTDATAQVTVDYHKSIGLEQLRSVAFQSKSPESIEVNLEQIAPLPKAIIRDLQQAGFETLGEVLRWSSGELHTSGTLSPGRQVRLLEALSRHILSFN